MKLFRKTFSVVLAIAMLFSVPTLADAGEFTREEKLDYLVSSGIPLAFFENKEDAEIDNIVASLYGKDIRYMGSETVSMSETVDFSGVSPAGVIPESDMKLIISKVSEVVYDSNKDMYRIKEIYVYVDYIWTSGKPFWQWSDGITVNWDASVFTFKSGSFRANDYKLLVSTQNWENTTSLSNPFALAQGGLGYYAKLTFSETVLGTTVSALQHKGSASFTLLPKQSPMYLKTAYTTDTYSTAINVEYLHVKNPGIFSVSFSYNGFGVSASVPLTSDSVAKSTTYYYSYS